MHAIIWQRLLDPKIIFRYKLIFSDPYVVEASLALRN